MKNESKILLIDKPEGMTSHDVVDKVRKITGEKRVGHAGTLDPMATGLLIVLVGREMTKKQAEFMKKDKVYEAEIVLGAVSDTYDREGKIVNYQLLISNYELSKEKVQKEIKENFIGEIEQIPPMYSAIKVKGKKLYEYARKGQKVKVEPRNVIIYSFEVLEIYQYYPELILESPIDCLEKHEMLKRVQYDKCQVRYDNLYKLQAIIHCSSGTYIRSLAHDLGQKLGCGGYLNQLRRIKIGKFSINDAILLDKLEK